VINLKNIFKKLWSTKFDNKDSRAKCFREDLKYNDHFESIDRGVSRTPLNQIVGSVGKCSAFNSEFRPKTHVPKDRSISIKKAMRRGKSLPPVNLYKVNDEYYVVDGNHRVAAAKELGRIKILAKTVELIPSNSETIHLVPKASAE
jgi:uncharacterized ParB-like nuclease family protein